jgi:hypothetical protein
MTKLLDRTRPAARLGSAVVARGAWPQGAMANRAFAIRRR